MIIARTLAEIVHDNATVVTVGTFDGVHRGHQAIISEVVSRAKSIGGRSMAVTFDPHPKEVIDRAPVALLMTLGERCEALAALQIDAALVVRFTPEFSRLSPREFYVRYIIEGIGAREVVEGHDHTFGRDREAGVTTLVELGREFGVDTTAVHPVLIGGERVGSSAIRRALGEGNVGKANRFLGRMYELGGTVVKGDARGASLGFPTANVRPNSGQKVVPMNGVYAVRVEWKEKLLDGMLNIGVRPTVTDGSVTTIEAHMFDFRENIYGDPLRILFAERVRDERKFSSKEELITQLGSDRERCKEILASMPALMNHS